MYGRSLGMTPGDREGDEVEDQSDKRSSTSSGNWISNNPLRSTATPKPFAQGRTERHTMINFSQTPESNT
jgi:hypothetical protein